MSYNALPFHYPGKTWIFYAQAYIFGGFGFFGLVLGPLFLFGVMKDAQGRPATDAGVGLTITSVLLLLVFALAVFNIVARRRPMLAVCREGLAVNMIGSSSLDGVPLIPSMIRVAWLVVSRQGFKQQVILVPWQSLHHADISGLPMARVLTIVGPIYRASDQAFNNAIPLANQVVIREVAFDDPLEEIAEMINLYRRTPEIRCELSSWDTQNHL